MDAGLFGFVVLLAAFVAAVGVLWRALVNMGRAVRDLDARVRRFLDLTEPDSDDD